jgi:hypothetical protein
MAGFGCQGQVSGVRKALVKRKFSISIFDLFEPEQISNYKKIPNYKHQIFYPVK